MCFVVYRLFSSRRSKCFLDARNSAAMQSASQCDGIGWELLFCQFRVKCLEFVEGSNRLEPFGVGGRTGWLIQICVISQMPRTISGLNKTAVLHPRNWGREGGGDGQAITLS